MSDPHSPRPQTAEEAVEKALLYTFQLSNKDYRKMQAAFSEVSFIRALEQDGYTVCALPAAEPVDAAWEALKRDIIKSCPDDFPIAILAVTAHRPSIEAAIRSAGTPPASRDVLEGPFALCPVCGRPEQVEFRDDWQAAVEAGSVIPIVGCGNPWHYNGMEAPPEPVGGRVREAIAEHRLGLYVIAAEKLGLTAEQAMAVIEERDPYLAAALQASPPTGVSDGVALRDELPRAEYARLLGVEDLAHLLVSGWDHGYPLADSTESEHELIDRLRTALAREQADSEPER